MNIYFFYLILLFSIKKTEYSNYPVLVTFTNICHILTSIYPRILIRVFGITRLDYTKCDQLLARVMSPWCHSRHLFTVLWLLVGEVWLVNGRNKHQLCVTDIPFHDIEGPSDAKIKIVIPDNILQPGHSTSTAEK
jgi:hypothetical protein